MKYAMCPNCGRRLCKGESGTKVEIECPKCGELMLVLIQDDDLHISKPYMQDKFMHKRA